jgi:hypothetical protein
LGEINWNAVQAMDFRRCKEDKQAEFLIEGQFSWELVERIGVYSLNVHGQASAAVEAATHKPLVEILPAWYY